MLIYLSKFVISLIGMTIVCTILWETCINNHIYNSTDGGSLDYLSPGDWVHDKENSPVKQVPRVVIDRDMEHADSILQGWTVDNLWMVWSGLLGVSVLVSAAVARLPWEPRWLRT